MRLLILVLCTIIGCIANAQKKVQYTGGVEGGLLMGSNPASGYIFTTQGLAYKQYTLSAGSGIDFYSLRSIPLFIDVKRRFGNRAVQPFVQAAAGYNFTSNKSTHAKMIYIYNGVGNFKPGLFAKGGGGLLFRAQKKLKIAVSAGYSYKTATYHYQPYVGTPWSWQIVPVKDVYHFNRWYLGAGIVW